MHTKHLFSLPLNFVFLLILTVFNGTVLSITYTIQDPEVGIFSCVASGNK